MCVCVCVEGELCLRVSVSMSARCLTEKVGVSRVCMNVRMCACVVCACVCVCVRERVCVLMFMGVCGSLRIKQNEPGGGFCRTKTKNGSQNA